MAHTKVAHDTRIENVFYHRVNNNIVAIVVYKTGALGFGTARCEKNDKWNERLGRKRALATAHPLPSLTEKIYNAAFDAANDEE